MSPILSLFTPTVIARFFRSMYRAVAYMIRNRTLTLSVSSKVLAKRLVACQLGCDQYLPGTQQCGVCKCFILAKARMVTEDCPHPEENRWK